MAPALWAVLAVCVGLSLAVGSGAIGTGHGKPPSLYQRTLQVAGEYRCPVCAGESVAASQAPEAVEIRQLVEHWLQEGDSQATIRSFLVHDYGLSILERPPASGVTVLVWVLPVVAGALAITGLGLGFVRWRRATLAWPSARGGGGSRPARPAGGTTRRGRGEVTAPSPPTRDASWLVPLLSFSQEPCGWWTVRRARGFPARRLPVG